MTRTAGAGGAGARARGWLLAAGLLLVGSDRAAGQGSQAAPQTRSLFRTVTEVVEVDAIVTDRDGRFVADLAPEAFQVFEDGVVQAIDWLFVVRDGEVFEAGREGECTSTSRTVSPQRVFIFVLDDEHLSPGSVQRVREGLGRFLEREFRPADIGGLVTGGRMAGSQLTSVREDLARWVRGIRPAADVQSRRLDLQRWPRLVSEGEAVRVAAGDREVRWRAVERARLEDPPFCGKADCEAFVIEKAQSIVAGLRMAARRTLGVLSALTPRLGAIEGRKTLVLFTEGFFVDEAQADLDRIVADAARAGVTIHAVDPRGLGRTAPAGALAEPGPAGPLDVVSLGADDMFEDGPNRLAVDTGGRFIRNQDRVDAALSVIARDAGSYYIIGYTPTSAARDGRFRRIEVAVTRPGLEVRARKGYVAAERLPALTRAGPAPATPSSFGVPADRRAEASAADAPARSPSPPVPASSATSTPPVTPTASSATAVPLVGGAVRLRPDVAARVEALQRDEPARESSPAGTRTPPGADARARAGWEHYQNGEVEAARQQLAAAVASGTVRPWVHYALGLAELASGRPREAASAWEHVRATVPEFEPVYFDLADAYLMRGETSTALRVLRAAEARWSDDPEVFNALGVIQTRRGALDDAIRSFERAASLAPHDATAFFNLGKAFELRYARSRRWSRTAKSWSANEADLGAAIEHYGRAVELGGPLADAAREALAGLNWNPR